MARHRTTHSLAKLLDYNQIIFDLLILHVKFAIMYLVCSNVCKTQYPYSFWDRQPVLLLVATSIVAYSHKST